MKVGEKTKFGKVSFIDYDMCFVQFCIPGSNGVYGVFSMTDEEILSRMDGDMLAAIDSTKI